MIEYNENKLRQIVAECNTYRDVLHKFERNESGASYKILHKRLNEWKIDTLHFLSRSELMVANQGIYPRKSNEEIFNINDIGRNTIKNRIIEENLIEYKCKFCDNIGIWNGIKISLILDHINGINNDNHLENLRFLCPNCNATLETHCKGAQRLVLKIKRKRKYSSHLSQRKVKERPSLNELNEMLKSMSYCAIGKKYGVSDNAIRRWIKCYH